MGDIGLSPYLSARTMLNDQSRNLPGNGFGIDYRLAASYAVNPQLSIEAGYSGDSFRHQPSGYPVSKYSVNRVFLGTRIRF